MEWNVNFIKLPEVGCKDGDASESQTGDELSYRTFWNNSMFATVCDAKNTDYGLFKRQLVIRQSYKSDLWDSADRNDVPMLMLSRASKRLLVCDTCDYCAFCEDSLKTHVAEAHAPQVLKFKCTECSYETPRRYLLVTHVRKHTGEKNFECELCSYRTGDRSNLSKHRKTHGDAALQFRKRPPKPAQSPKKPKTNAKKVVKDVSPILSSNEHSS